MREIFLLAAALTLTGCMGLPKPDPNQAWVDLQVPEDNALHAQEVDAQALDDNRYFEVEPGSHELTVRYQFTVAPSNIGPQAAPLSRDCQLNIKYSNFNAGERYQLEAGSLGFTPWAKLYDQQRRLVGRAQPAGCQRA
ncbi:PA0061/PA0062 family lipoprotein [Pseudomonas japonica]|uniref:PA0061/PA0062 family lipoprotein n=1 Tax=Pseudomonas japonica TaxID=256466 RepID=UPI0015E39F26|nr:hypothetical protein [Pseudomonas japonica]MBA1241583.1 hypothetical protein [Pseudomonas japonica]